MGENGSWRMCGRFGGDLGPVERQWGLQMEVRMKPFRPRVCRQGRDRETIRAENTHKL